jgi:hypothetical protein
MKVLLVIALLIGDCAVPRFVYRMQDEEACAEASQHPAVVESYRAILGPDVILYCVKEKR